MADPFFDKVGTRKPRSRPSQAGNVMWAYAERAADAPTQPVPDPTITAVASSESERRWAANDKTFWGVSSTYDEIPAGVYRCGEAPGVGPILIRQLIETDNLLELPDEASGAIIEEFQAFWRLGHEFRKRGFLCKRGFLLWGPPGSGKTSCVQMLMKRLSAEMGGVTLFLDQPHTAAVCLQMLRHIEPSRPIIVVMEDVDALIEKFGENEYLALLDGEAQVDNVVFLATTNYPERLDRRFVDRPSRFDTIKYIGMPTAAARRKYLETKEPDLTADELDRWVALSDGFSIAHMKELIIAVRCFGQSLEAVVERLEEMHERQPASGRAPDRQKFGFGVRGGIDYAADVTGAA